EAHVVLPRNAHNDAARRLAEERGRGIHPVALLQLAEPHAGADPEAQHALAERLDESAVGEVMSARDERLLSTTRDAASEAFVLTEVHARRDAAEVFMNGARPRRTV